MAAGIRYLVLPSRQQVTTRTATFRIACQWLSGGGIATKPEKNKNKGAQLSV
jgi:hypothetical protein